MGESKPGGHKKEQPIIRMMKALSKWITGLSRNSERKYRSLFELAKDAVIISDTNGVITDANKAAYELLGMPREKLIGLKRSAIHPPDIAREHEENFRMRWKNNEDSIFTDELIIQRLDGRQVQVMVSSNIVSFNGDQCIQSIFYDLTPRDVFMTKLTESEEKFSKAFNASPGALSITTTDEDPLILEVNDGFVRISGYSRGEIINHRLSEINLWIRGPETENIHKKIAERIKLSNVESCLRTKSGDVRTLLVSSEYIQVGNLPCVLTAGADITEHILTKKALSKTEQQLSRVFRMTPQMVLLTRMKDGRIIDTNENFNDMSGYSRMESIGYTTTELGLWANPEDRDNMRHIVSEKGRVTNYEVNFKTKYSKVVTGLFSVEPIELDGEQCLVAIITDITERKRIEQALRESEEKLTKTFQAIPERICISRANDGTIIDVNDSFLLPVGKTRDEIIGHSVYEINIWNNKKNRENLINEIKEHGRVVNRELPHTTQSGEKQITMLSADLINIGDEPCLITISMDITERKRIEQALKESEEKFSKVFRTLPLSVAITRIKDGIFVDVNDNFCRGTGHTYEEVIGHTGDDLKLAERPGQRDQIIKLINERGQVWNQEIVYGTNNDNYRVRLFSADIIELGGEPCMVSLSTDITERKKMEKALKESEEKFSKAFKATPDSVSISRVKDGVFIDVNDSFCQSKEVTREKVIGHTAAEIGIWIEKDARDEMIWTIREHGRISNREINTVSPSGEDRTLQVSADIVNINREPCLIIISNDISERKKIEQALKESEEKFHKAFQNIPEAIAISRVRDGIFIDVNDTFCRMKGLTRDEVVGHSGDKLGLKEQPGVRDDLVKTIQEHGRIMNREIVFNPGTSNMRATLFSADILNIGGELCMLSIATDITERKKMEESLANEAVRRRILIEQSNDGIVILYQDGAVYEANKRFCEMVGYSLEELKTMHAWDWIVDDTRETIIRNLQNADEAGRHFETHHRRKDGSIYNVEVSNNSVIFTGQKLVFGVCRDITARKQAEADLQQALMELKLSSAQLKATNKELESFSYSVSHDLRSPLRSIDGFSQALLEDYAPKLDETAKDYLNRMRNASQKMGELIDGLLKLSRLTRGEMRRQAVNLSDMAHEISQRLRETNPERRAEFIIAPDIKVNGDAQMLRVMMENLLSNAWKFTQKTPEARIEFGSETENGRKVLFIKDNGAGFDMAFVDKLFSAFQRLHDEVDFPGTGIGLATIQRILNRHGGSIRAEGAVGRGAKFTFTI